MDAELSPEDAKIITLARSARARTGAASGGAVRDETGRTYAGADVSLPSLSLSGLQVAVAMALSSGAESLEAAAIVSATEPDEDALAVAWDLKAVRVVLAGYDGAFVKSYENPGH